jgi:hypothetical protein
VIALRAKTTSESELLDGRAAFIEARIIHEVDDEEASAC